MTAPSHPWADHSFLALASVLLRSRLAPQEPAQDEGGDHSEESPPKPRDWLFFRHDPSLQFPVGEVSDLSWKKPKKHDHLRLELTSTFFGLFGTVSPLPAHDTAAVLRDESDVLRDFFDVFHHRLYTLLFQGWTKYRWHATYKTADDRIAQGVLSLAGFGTPGLADSFERRTGLSSTCLLRYAGLLAQRPRSSAVLAAVLRDHLAGLPVALEEFIPVRCALAPEDRTRLPVGRGRAAEVGARRLGVDAIAGTHVLDTSSRLRIVLGPLERADFERFLPGAQGLRDLRSLLEQAAPRHLEFEVVLLLQAGAQPECRLSSKQPPRLGWTGWVTPTTPRVGRVSLGTRAPSTPPRRQAAVAGTPQRRQPVAVATAS